MGQRNRVFLGIYAVRVVAIPLGIAIGWYKRVSYLFDPFINAMNATPRVALLPLVIIWLGIGVLSKSVSFFSARFSDPYQYPRRRERPHLKPVDCGAQLRGFRWVSVQIGGHALHFTVHFDRTAQCFGPALVGVLSASSMPPRLVSAS
jgi:hypothetical protein